MKTWTYTVPPWDTSTGSVLDRVWLNPSKLSFRSIKQEVIYYAHVRIALPVTVAIRNQVEGPIRKELG